MSNDTKKKNNNRLISIRIPEETLKKLRSVASEKGTLGYQQLIKNYIDAGLNQSDETIPFYSLAHDLESATIERNPTIKKTQAVKVKKKKTRRKSDKDFTEFTNSPVISEDIRALVNHLEDYHDFFAGRTFLITGAFGFLGRYMVFLLKYLNAYVLKDKAKALLLDNFVTGYEQKILSDENLQFVRQDVIAPYETSAHIDYIIHAAGIASPVYYTKYPIETMDVGTVGTRRMLELGRQKNVKGFIFMSSSEVYGDPDPLHVPTRETYRGNVSILGSRACYDESKRFGETMCSAYWRVYSTPVKMIRPFNVYGPGIRPDDFRVLPNFIEHALRREPLPVHGDGRNTRSFCYINDAIESIFKVLFSTSAGQAFNIGNPEPEISVKELAEKVASMISPKVDVVNIDPPHAVYASADPKRRCPDITKVHLITGYWPRYSLDEGLEKTISWFREL